MKKTAWALASAALLSLGLTGCAGLNQEEAKATAEPATVENTVTAPQICLIPNPRVNTPELLNAISTGVKHVGFDVKVLPADANLEACDHCFSYALKLNEKQNGLEAIIFQSFRKGEFELGAQGPANEKGELTLQVIANYAAAFGEKLMKVEKGEKPNLPEAPVAK